MWHGSFALPTIQYLKPHQVQQFFGRDMLFNILHLADWKKIGDYRQCHTDLNPLCKNHLWVDWDYKVGDQVLLRKEGISSAKQKVVTNVILGLSHQFIQMGQLGFNTEQYLND